MNLFTRVMTKEVMMTLSTELEGKAVSDTVDDLKELVMEDLLQKLFDKQVLDTKTRPSTANSNDLLPCVSDAYKEGVTFSSSNKNDYASLVSMLVIRLLKKVDSLRQDIGTHQEGLPDYMLDMSKELIQKIL